MNFGHIYLVATVLVMISEVKCTYNVTPLHYDNILPIFWGVLYFEALNRASFIIENECRKYSSYQKIHLHALNMKCGRLARLSTYSTTYNFV